MFGHFVSYLNRLGHRTYNYVLRLSAHKVSRGTFLFHYAKVLAKLNWILPLAGQDNVKKI